MFLLSGPKQYTMSIAAMRHRADAVNFSNKSRQEEGIVKLSLAMDILVTDWPA